MHIITEQTAKELSRKYGSPLFVFSEEAIRNNLLVFRNEFTATYPNIEIAYSYKVNSLPGILELIHRGGAWAEAASGFEYGLAKKLGLSGDKIVFNGPLKTNEELCTAIEDGAYINVDHNEELSALEQIASKLEREINIGIRVNTDVGIEQLPDRFGFNIESGEAERAVSRCIDAGLNVAGLHIHLTSYIIESRTEGIPASAIKFIWPKGPGAYEIASRTVVNFARTIKEEYGVSIDYLDMGGGFPTVDSLGSYVEAVTGPVLDEYRENEKPLLILEPGRAIVSDAGHLICTVAAVKDLPGGQRAIVTDAGINILPTSLFKFQEIESLTQSDSELRDTVVYGPLCLQTDIISRAKLPDLNAGDMLLVKNVGTYNIPQSSSFIFEQPAAVMLDGDVVKVLRSAGKSD